MSIRILCILLLLPATSLACIVGQRSSLHKSLHFAGEAAIAGIGTYATGNVWIGVGAAAAVGAYREVWKEKHGFSCEYSSIAYDIAGIAVGSFIGSRLLIQPKPGGATVSYYREF